MNLVQNILLITLRKRSNATSQGRLENIDMWGAEIILTEFDYKVENEVINKVAYSSDTYPNKGERGFAEFLQSCVSITKKASSI